MKLNEIIENFYRYILPITQSIIKYNLILKDQECIKKYKEIGNEIYNKTLDGTINTNEEYQNKLYQKLKDLNYLLEKLNEFENMNFDSLDELFLKVGKQEIEKVLGEIKINNPTIKFPLKVNKKDWDKIAIKLEKNGYVWFNGNKLTEWNPFINALAKPLTDTVILNDNDNDITWQDYEINEIKINKPISLVVGHRYMLDTSRGTGHISKRRGEYLGKFNDKHYFFQPGLGKLEIPHSEIGKRLIKDLGDSSALDEIKVNKPGLNFPIKIETPEQAQKIGKELIRQGYTWKNGLEIEINSYPFIESNYFFSKFYIYKSNIYKQLKWSYREPKILNESIQINPKQYIKLLNTLVEECCKELDIQKPVIKLINNDKYTNIHKSYGGYFPDTNEIKLVIYGRLLKDSCTTLAHECYHSFQNKNGLLTPNSGGDGTKEENEANSFAGRFMRQFGRNNPEIYFMRYDKN